MDSDVAKRFVRVLEQFARYSADDYSAAAPAHTTIAARLGVGLPAISNAVTFLRARGLMIGDVVTVAGHEYLRTHRALVSAAIPIAGKVQAGFSKTDTLARFIENYRELAYTEGPCLPLVNTRTAGGTVALEVRGASMEFVRIFEGDYVIVELFGENEGPKAGERLLPRFVSHNQYCAVYSLLCQPLRERDFLAHFDSLFSVSFWQIVGAELADAMYELLI